MSTPTSSRLLCFALLALTVEVPDSLGVAWFRSDSNAGRGMCDGESEKVAWPLPLGVPLYVPVADIFDRTLLLSRTDASITMTAFDRLAMPGRDLEESAGHLDGAFG